MVGVREVQNVVEFFRGGLLRAVLLKRRFVVRSRRVVHLRIVADLWFVLLRLRVRVVLPLVLNLLFLLLAGKFFLIGLESGSDLGDHGERVMDLLLEIAVLVLEFVKLLRYLA